MLSFHAVICYPLCSVILTNYRQYFCVQLFLVCLNLKMNATWTALDESTRAVLHSAIVSKSVILTQQGLSNCIWAVQALGLSIYDAREDDIMAVGIRNSFSIATVRVTSNFTAQGVATTLYSMGKMGCVYSTIPIQTRMSLESAFIREGSFVGAKEVSMALYGLAKMDASWSIFPNNFRLLIISAVTKSCRSMDEQQLGNTVWALCQLGYGIKGQLGKALFAAIVMKQNELKKQSLLAIFQGLALQALMTKEDSYEYNENFETIPNQEALWKDLPPALKDALLASLKRLLEEPASMSGLRDSVISYEPKLAGTVLYWLGRLRAWHGDLPLHTLSRLLTHINVAAIDLLSEENTQSLDNETGEKQNLWGTWNSIVLGVNGIANMGVTWDYMDNKDRDMLYSTVTNTLSRHVQALTQIKEQGEENSPNCLLSSAGISSLLWSFGRMGLKFRSFPLPTSLDGDEGTVGTSAFPVDTKETGSSVTKTQESKLEKNMLLAVESVASVMTSHELAWSLWALAKTGISFSDLIAGKRPLGMLLLLAVNKHIGAMEERELSVVLWVSDVSHYMNSV